MFRDGNPKVFVVQVWLRSTRLCFFKASVFSSQHRWEERERGRYAIVQVLLTANLLSFSNLVTAPILKMSKYEQFSHRSAPRVCLFFVVIAPDSFLIRIFSAAKLVELVGRNARLAVLACWEHRRVPALELARGGQGARVLVVGIRMPPYP